MQHGNRVVSMSGGRNFRDLGGYETADGKRVKWGRIYRSGALSALTGSDYRHFDALGIKVVVDLRSTRERQVEPFRNSGLRPVLIRSWEYETDGREIARRLIDLGGDVPGIREAIFDIYRDLIWRFAERYREIFTHLVAEDTPLIFNCAAGKDRTGIAAALILTALGVRQSAVLEDYSLTERLLDFTALMADGNSHATGFSMLHKLPDPARSLLQRSDPAYLEAAFQAIDDRAGSMERFFSNYLGLDESGIAKLRNHLLE